MHARYRAESAVAYSRNGPVYPHVSMMTKGGCTKQSAQLPSRILAEYRFGSYMPTYTSPIWLRCKMRFEFAMRPNHLGFEKVYYVIPSVKGCVRT